jgi:hypothetical protein
MISIIDPDVVSHVLRPTVYRATDTQVEASSAPLEPQKKLIDLNRMDAPDLDARLLTAASR